MGSVFDDPDEEHENWFKEHKQAFDPPPKMPKITRRRRRRKQRKKPCPHCRLLAPISVFKDAKCLACQAADYLNTL